MSATHVKCNLSASLITNNLCSSAKNLVYMHLNKVQVVDIASMSADRAKIAQLSLATPATSKGKDQPSEIRVLKYDFGEVIVVATLGGIINIFDAGTLKLMGTYLHEREERKEVHLQGIAGGGSSGELFVGSGSGKILVFKVDPKKKILALETELSVSSGAITSVDIESNTLICGDEDGAVHLWDVDGKTRKHTIKPKGYPCMSVRAGHGIAVIAFSTGHIWMVDVNAGALRVEVAAHSRSIQALHVHPTKPKVAVASEDTYVSIWSLPTAAGEQIENIASYSPNSSLLTGVVFLEDRLCSTAYDSRYVSTKKV